MFAVDEKGIFLLPAEGLAVAIQVLTRPWYSQYESMIEVENGTKVEKGILMDEDLINGLIRYLRDVEYFKQLVKPVFICRGHGCNLPTKSQNCGQKKWRREIVAYVEKEDKDSFGRPNHVKWRRKRFNR